MYVYICIPIFITNVYHLVDYCLGVGVLLVGRELGGLHLVVGGVLQLEALSNLWVRKHE